MVDKYRITDSPKSWRSRNCVEVPEEYLDVLRQKDNRIIAIFVALSLVVVSVGVLFSDVFV